MDTIRRATVDGTRLAYRERGSGDPVLLLHPGFVADAMLPLLNHPALCDGFRVIAYHRRGYGDSDRGGGAASLSRQAADALALLDRLGIDRAHLVGHSFGANVALQAALDAPERVGALVLMEPPLGFALSPDSAQAPIAAAAAAVPRYAAGDQAAAVDIWLTVAFGPGYRDVLDRALPGAWDTAVADAPAPFSLELPALRAWRVGVDDLARLRPPVLSVVHHDQRWPGFQETHEVLLNRVPRCEGLTLPLGSHLLQLVDPRAVAEGISPFLARHPLGTGGP